MSLLAIWLLPSNIDVVFCKCSSLHNIFFFCLLTFFCLFHFSSLLFFGVLGVLNSFTAYLAGTASAFTGGVANSLIEAAFEFIRT